MQIDPKNNNDEQQILSKWYVFVKFSNFNEAKKLHSASFRVLSQICLFKRDSVQVKQPEDRIIKEAAREKLH